MHNWDGRVARARVALAGTDWRVVPDDREVYDYAVHGINYIHQQNCHFALCTELADRALAPVGGLWPPDAVNVLLEGAGWPMDDVTNAVAFWHSLMRY